MHVGVLGPLEATVDDRSVALPRGRQRILLAALAVHAGEVVSTDRLVDMVWEQDPPPNAVATLQVHVSNLRSLLRTAGADGEVIATRAPGYVLTAADSVDAVRFERDATAGRNALRAGRPDEAARLLAAALELWRGPALGDVDADFARPHRSRLEDLRLATLEDRVEAELVLGRHAELAGWLPTVARQHPHQERLHGQLMLALYRSGRQADALRAFQELRTALVDELGLEPSPEVQRLEDAILQQQPDLDWEPASRPGSTLVGRDDELGVLAAELAAPGLVTLVGPGGVGKTSLATVAFDAPVVDLVAAAGVWEAVAARLGVREQPGQTLQQSIVATGPTRLVLDNCEHVVAEAAAVAAALVEQVPALTVLATSRVPLGISGERVVELRPLVPAAAVELFVERARAAGPGFVPTTAVGDVVRALDHLPLAIELAAARTRLLDLDQLAARLDDALGLLTAGPRDAPERHRTLRGAIEWSHALLAPEEQAVFRRLAVFAGPFTLEEAEAVAGDRTGLGDLELLDLLDRLVRASMVTVEDGADGHRFRLLETVRQFAAEQLIASAEEPLVRRRHFDVFAERPPDRDDTNARAALAWALEAGDEVVGALELAHKLATGWYVHGALSEGRRWLEAALAAGAGRAPSDLLSRVELARANICYGQGDMNAAEAAFEAAAEHGEPAVVARAHFGLGNLAVLRGDPSASTLLEEAAIAAERLDDDDLMMRVANSLGMVARRAGDFAAARDHAETGLRAARRLGDRVAVATVLINLANLHQALERPDEARDRLEEALVLSRQEGFTRGVASALGSLGVITDDPDEARAYLEESLELARAPGDRQVVAVTLANLGRVRLKGGDIGAARISFEEYRAVSEQLGDRRGVAQAGRSLADVARRAGDFEGAARDGAEALRLHLEIGDQDRLVEALEVVAAVLAVTGRVEVAGDVLAACDRARVDMSMPRDAEDDDVRAVIVAAAGEPTTRDAPSVGDATKAALTALGD